MAELADAYGSGPYVRKDMQVQVLLSAPAPHIMWGAFFVSKYLICNIFHNVVIERAVHIEADVNRLVLVLVDRDLPDEHSQIYVRDISVRKNCLYQLRSIFQFLASFLQTSS